MKEKQYGCFFAQDGSELEWGQEWGLQIENPVRELTNIDLAGDEARHWNFAGGWEW